MKTKTLAAAFLLGIAPAHSAITVQAHFELGDNGAGTSNLPLDSSGNGRNFTAFVNTATINLTGGGYNDDAHYYFGGSQGYYDIGYDAPEDNVGLEIWVRTFNTTQNDITIFSTGSNADGISVGYSGGWFGAVSSVAGVGFVQPWNYTAGDWVHLAIVRENGTSTFFVNGVATGTSGATPNNATMTHMAVKAGGTSGFFDGDIAEARIFTFDTGEFSTSDLLFPAIPEPGTALLGSIGLLALLRRRR